MVVVWASVTFMSPSTRRYQSPPDVQQPGRPPDRSRIPLYCIRSMSASQTRAQPGFRTGQTLSPLRVINGPRLAAAPCPLYPWEQRGASGVARRSACLGFLAGVSVFCIAWGAALDRGALGALWNGNRSGGCRRRAELSGG